MDSSLLNLIDDHMIESIDVLTKAQQDTGLRNSMIAISDAIVSAMREGNKVMLAGNGGSAGDAQHIAGEFLSRLNFDRAPLPAIALTTDTSVLTAVGNDYGYEHVFERQVRGLGRPGDVFIGISTSGRSPNIVKALQAARAIGLTTIAFCGQDPRDMGPLSDHALCVPSGSTPLIQQVHIVAAHIICGAVEQQLFGAATAAA